MKSEYESVIAAEPNGQFAAHFRRVARGGSALASAVSPMTGGSRRSGLRLDRVTVQPAKGVLVARDLKSVEPEINTAADDRSPGASSACPTGRLAILGSFTSVSGPFSRGGGLARGVRGRG